MQSDDKFKEKIEFENALKLRLFEIDLFWKRSWFFGALLIALVGAFYKLKTIENPLFPPVTVAFVLFITTLLQCLMNRGSKFWQERWEYMTMNREGSLEIELTKLKKYQDPDKGEWYYINGSILAKGENIFTRSRRFSVSKLTFLVWDLVFICTMLNWINEGYSLFSSNPDWTFTIKISVFYSLLIGYVIVFWTKGKVYEGFKKEQFDGVDLDQLCENYADNKVV
ncbi:MAG: hypothetical protein RL596_2233 [Bacteroidota bacterium]|jgi:hypothetical protein